MFKKFLVSFVVVISISFFSFCMKVGTDYIFNEKEKPEKTLKDFAGQKIKAINIDCVNQHCFAFINFEKESITVDAMEAIGLEVNDIIEN